MIAAVIISYGIVVSKPKPERKAKPNNAVTVEVVPLAQTDFQVWVDAQGSVQPRTESTLIPEVAGRIIDVAPQLRDGAFFEAGQTLIQIDPSNYRIAVTVAESKVAEMKLLLVEEQAKARQAEKNWQRLGNGGKPSDLVLRKPQLLGARAALSSAEAELEKAQLDLRRTRITAPYVGRVLDQMVDVGQYVAPGTVLAKVYAVDYAEIRLPLSDVQLQFIDVPELYRGQSPKSLTMPEVVLSVSLGQQQVQWQGRIVRAEGAYDTRSRRLSLVAQVDDPYAKNAENKPPLKVGQFVDARIKGRLLQQVFVIPRAAMRENNQVMIVDRQSRLSLRQVDPVWRDQDTIVVATGLEQGEWLCVTPLQYVVNGMLVAALHNGQAVFGPQGK